MICVLSKIYIETYPIEVALNVGLGERIKPWQCGLHLIEGLRALAYTLSAPLPLSNEKAVFLFCHGEFKPYDSAAGHHLGSERSPQQALNDGILILDFPASRSVKNLFLVFINYPVSTIMQE
jgi:hypothetical protein